MRGFMVFVFNDELDKNIKKRVDDSTFRFQVFFLANHLGETLECYIVG